MSTETRNISNGTITSPEGFLAGAAAAGVKATGTLDMGILYSEHPCTSVGVFTSNKVKAAPILLCQRHLQNRQAQAIIVNSGCANACTGCAGELDAEEMTKLTAQKLGLSATDVLVASTGLIGSRLPMQLIRNGICNIGLSKDGGQDLAQAIMTTDTFAKETAVSFTLGGRDINIGACAKGAGMIHPNMATLLCFITTDAAIDAELQQELLREAVDNSFNMLTIDSDTSTNDTVLLLANGISGNQQIRAGTPEARLFLAGLETVCTNLAKHIARDGEGATKMIEVHVEGASTSSDARLAARTIASSALVKTAVHGCDPNWGRVVAALGRSGAEIDQSKLDLHIGDCCLLKSGSPSTFDDTKARTMLGGEEILIRVNLHLGACKATAWGCDLSKDYVAINSEYST